jgi:hypothetical protein
MFFLNLFLACVTIFYASQAVPLPFSGTVPPNIYTPTMWWGQTILANITWNASATNLIVHVFNPG